MDATETEKIYVAVGYDIVDGFQTLSWAMKKWNSHPCSIVILHVNYNTSKKYVPTLRIFLTFVSQFSFSLHLSSIGFHHFGFGILLQSENSLQKARLKRYWNVSGNMSKG